MTRSDPPQAAQGDNAVFLSLILWCNGGTRAGNPPSRRGGGSLLECRASRGFHGAVSEQSGTMQAERKKLLNSPFGERGLKDGLC